MTLDQIVAARRQALLDRFVRDVFPPLVEADGTGGLTGLMHLDEFTPGSTPGQLGRRKSQNAAMVPGPAGSPHAASLWVRGGYGGYRPAYAAFLKANYGLTVTPEALAAYDVDHLLNRARSGNDDVLLRIEALPLSINRQWGSFLERLASSQHIAGNRRTSRLMSYLIAAKVAGLIPPATLDDQVGIARLAGGLSALGLNAVEVRAGLDNMLAHIARNQP